MKQALPLSVTQAPNRPKLTTSLLVLGVWIFTACTTLIVSVHTYNILHHTQAMNSLLMYQAKTFVKADNAIMAYAALPASVSEVRPTVVKADARPITIEKYLQAYKSPLAGFGDFIVQTADKHGLDPYLIVAIAQQESNLCKITPQDSHNCWGWGVHSEGTLKFESYEQAVQAVIRGLKEKYFDQGYDTPEKIMSKYTPQSSGSWARGVNQFLAELTSGNF